MNNSNFENLIVALQNATLGGTDAQFKLAPELRKPFSKEAIANRKAKKAAVLALFYPNERGETMLLLTLRADYKGTHGAQVSFPGGKVEIQDKNLQQTALRESFEEVGLAPENIEIIKELTDVYIPPSNFLVTPFIGYTNNQPVFYVNEEVAEIIEVPLKDMLNDASVQYMTKDTSYAKEMNIPYFNLNNHVVWGATAMIISEIKELLKSL
ncbi:NUDIX hydrolase [Flavicella sediminum]|uniref:NUDIX hydrolase n=1 Tax=Flavicella sediminum TaxID=2585141 RepID=UPI00111E677F|nr:CoA pyrophosphatase [Flavicella sediminum]